MIRILALWLVLIGTAHAQTREPFNTFMNGLPHATIPLGGTEPMIVLQGGSTKQVPASVVGGSQAGIVSVLSYGAKCDSTTDDTAAIQAAFNAAFPPLAGVVSPQLTTSILLIPSRCVITSTITARAIVSGYQNAFIIQCTGNGTGLIWNGTDNTGPMLQFGDPTGAHQDGGFTINNCYFDGRDASHKPSQVIEFKNINAWHVRDITVSLPQNARVYGGILCDSANCELAEIYHSNFACLEDCVKFTAPNNGTILQMNQFSVCGRYCYEGTADASVTFLSNYFEGDKATSLGSIWIAGDGDRLIANTFEDNNLAAGAGFRSVILSTTQDTHFYGNYYIGAGDGDYRIEIGTTGASDAEFFGEQNVIPGLAGFFIKLNSPQTVIWHGGSNCDETTLFTGADAFRVIYDNACGRLTKGSAGSYIIDTTGGGTTPGVIQATAFANSIFNGVPSLSGTCAGSVNTQIGDTIGSFKGAGAGCSGGTLTFGAFPTMLHGWSCSFANLTTPTNLLAQTASTQTSITATGTWAINEQINYQCLGF